MRSEVPEVVAERDVHRALDRQAGGPGPLGGVALEGGELVDHVDHPPRLEQPLRPVGLPVERTMHVALGNNLGYFGPHEELLRSLPGGNSTYWGGCGAGRFTIGIESDGKVKACPSLPTRPYVGGNVRDMPLEQIWQTDELAFARNRTTEELWGFCKTCYYADACKAGCSWTSHVTLGRRGNMPWCYHRASSLKRMGLRERLVPVVAAPGIPYDYGRMELVVEPFEESPPVPAAAVAK